MNRLAKLAFTLAEVLIVLGIIGIVAEMTVPTLMNNVSNQTQVSSLKKFYSEFSQGMKQYMLDQGCSDLACTNIFNGIDTDVTWNTAVDAAIRSEFKVLKSCNTNASGCGEYSRQLDGNVYVNPTFDPFIYGHSFITADGFLFMFDDGAAGSCDNWSTTNSTSKVKNACTFVYLDTNGNKLPNKWGRDLFYLVLGNDGILYPTGGTEMAKISADSDNYQAEAAYWRNNTVCGTAGSSVIPSGATGTNCAARIMEEAWQMNY